jgi:hypothetical protein
MTDVRHGSPSRASRLIRRLRGTEVADDTEGMSLRRRVEELEAEMQEARRLNRRLAELMDIVEELLVPMSQRDEAKVQQYLDSHSNLL